MVGQILDLSLNLRRIIDVYSSFIWNEYYVGYGDFELRLPMTPSALDYIKDGWYISIQESDKLMIIEDITIETDVQNGNVAVISGRSLESILLRRVLYSPITLTGSFQTAIMRLLNSNLLTASKSARKASRIVYVPSSDSYITALTVDSEHDAGENVYDIINGLCDYERVGFKLVPNYETSAFEFSLYYGKDRSYDQQTNPWVVFSAKYENLKSSEMKMDTRELKNVAIVQTTYTTTEQITKPDGTTESVSQEHTVQVEVNGEISDLERRELFMTCNLKPEEVDKSKFGKPEDRVNIRDYQEYMCVYFDSKMYKEDCAAVDAKYSSRVDNRKSEVKVWKPNYTNIAVDTVKAITIGVGLAGALRPKGEKESRSAQNDRKTAPISLENRGIPGEAPPGFGNSGRNARYWTLETRPETVEEWRTRNERVFAAWEKAYPDKREYEVWAWDFASASKRTEYEQALQDAQAEIDAEYSAAVADEFEKMKDQMRTLGMIELAPYLVITNFAGEIDPNVQFIFGRDYNLGDIVQIVNEFDFQAKTRVVGMLFSSEEGEGYKAIPTFESDDPSEVEL